MIIKSCKPCRTFLNVDYRNRNITTEPVYEGMLGASIRRSCEGIRPKIGKTVRDLEDQLACPLRRLQLVSMSEGSLVF